MEGSFPIGNFARLAKLSANCDPVHTGRKHIFHRLCPNLHDDLDHSLRIISAGSTDPARRAGMSEAIMPPASKSDVTTTAVHGSSVLTSKRNTLSPLHARYAVPIPTTNPMPSIYPACRRIRSRM